MIQNVKSNSNMSNFEIQTKLGKGSYGVVYKVRRKSDNKIYVLKQINIQNMSKRFKEDVIIINNKVGNK